MKDILIKYNETSPLYLSFFLVFLALAGTTMVTFLASLSSVFDYAEKDLKNAFISETTVNVLAGFTYSYIINKISTNKITIEEVTPIRYLDWVLTTPLLILSFVVYLNYTENRDTLVPKQVDFTPFSYIITLNIFMLGFGYAGETKLLNYWIALGLGFTSYFLLFYFIYDKYVKDSLQQNKNLFWVFTTVWALYGFSYLLDPIKKNIAYNILDVISKAGFGMYLWGSTFSDDLASKTTSLTFN